MLDLDNITILKLRQMQRAAKDKRRYVKITTALMLGLGFNAADTAAALGIDEATVYRYAEKYRASKDLDQYLVDNYTIYAGKLSADQLAQLEAELKSKLYTSAKQIGAFIKERFGVDYTAEGLVPLLKRIGFVYKKTRQVPAKADAAEQEAFLEQLEELVAMAESGEITLYYADATHPQHNTRPSYGWIMSGEDFTVASTPGRHRLNINGAVNALDPWKITVRTDDRIDTDSTIALFKDLEKRQPNGRIIVICDNARYYKSKALKEWLEGSRVEVISLPGYSPNLNLIERLWKFMHQKVIDPIYYPTKEIFREAVLGFFKDIKQHRTALESLLTLNFRVLSNSQTA